MEGLVRTSGVRASLRYKILLVDDHPVLREGFARLINNEPDIQVCGHAGSAANALEEIATLKPDLVISDIALDGSNGIDLVKNIKALHPEVAVLVL